MKRNILISGALLLTALCGAGAPKRVAKSEAQTVKESILATPAKSGGVYFNYPVTRDSILKAPIGFKPVYLSHYGRHGSRWVIGTSVHPKVVKWLKAQKKGDNLTPEGERVLGIVERSARLSEGNEGSLTQIGVQQHKGIGGRMAARFPELFKDGDTIYARSSVVPRCVVSMAGFVEGVKEAAPGVVMNMQANEGDMAYLVYHSKMADALQKRATVEYQRFQPVLDSLTASEATAAKLFKDPTKVENKPNMMRYLHDIASDFQCVDYPNEDLLSVFTAEDLVSQWKYKNLDMYLRHGMSPATNYEGALCSKSLLKNIIDEADRGLKGGSKVNLRFGHDIILMRLLSYLNVGENIGLRSSNPEEICAKWLVHEITPMAGNLQLIFYRNAYGEVLMTARLNEQPIKIQNLSHYPGHPYFYKWESVRRQWEQLAK